MLVSEKNALGKDSSELRSHVRTGFARLGLVISTSMPNRESLARTGF